MSVAVTALWIACFELNRLQFCRPFQNPLVRPEHQFRCILKFQFFFDAVSKGVDGRNGQLQFLGNLTRGFAFAEHLENLQLPVAQLFDRRNWQFISAMH